MTILNELIKYLGHQYKKYSGGEYYFYCPFCNHKNPKLAVNITSGKWHCWKCNTSGKSILSLLYKLKATGESISTVKRYLNITHTLDSSSPSIIPTVFLPEEYRPIDTSIECRPYVKYLMNRNVSLLECKKYKIGYCLRGRYAKRIIIPSYDSSEQLNYFVARAINESKYSYLLPPISKNVIGFDNLINWNDSIILCEGVFDAIALKRNAIPLFGKTMGSTLFEMIIKKNPPSVYVCLDSDAKSDALFIVKKLMSYGISCKYIEVTKKDIAEMNYDDIIKSVDNSIVMSFDTILKLKLST